MKKIIRFGLLPALTGILYLSLSSNSGGITGKSTSGCGGAGCHTAGVAATVIAVTGLPATYTAGSTYPVTLTVSNAGYTAATNEGGFDLTVSGGIISGNPAGTMLMGVGTELHHTTPQVLTASTATWTFNWTAPATGTSTTFNVAGNIVNGTGNPTGDAANLYTTTINAAAVLTPIVTTGSASAITPFGATISGLINANGITPGVGISFEYGLTTAYGNAPLGNPATATGSGVITSNAVLTGLTPNTTYHYRINATALPSTVTNGADKTFTTTNNTSVQSIKNLGISVYPNPTSDKLILENVNLKNPLFSVIGVDGKAISISANLVGNKTYSLNINALAVGTYILQTTSEGQIFTTKFSKQ